MFSLTPIALSILIFSEKEIPFREIENSDTIGISSGASAPEKLVQALLVNLKKDQKVSRNERCEVTGKKFKNCCGAL